MDRVPSDDTGVTLIEVLIASALTVVILIMSYQILGAGTKTANAVSRRSVNSSNAREAVDALEGNLRFATGVWVCNGTPLTTTATCSPPASLSTVATWSRTSTATLFVSNASGGTQPTCDEWTISGAGLQEDHVSGTGGTIVATFFAIPGVMAWVPALGATSTVQTSGFSLTLAGLIVIDLIVNSAAKASDSPSVVDTADAVSVHDFIAPNNLPPTAMTLPAPVQSC